MRIEVGDAERASVTPDVVSAVFAAMRVVDPGIRSACSTASAVVRAARAP